MKFKKLSPTQEQRVVSAITTMLREAMKEGGKYLSAHNPDYAETIGIMKGLQALGYGYLGPDNLDAVKAGRSTEPKHNLKWWLGVMAEDVQRNMC